MTQEEKSEAYDKALKRAMELYENFNGMILKKWLWKVFPELAEPSDERTRKALLHLVNSNKELSFGIDNYDGVKWEDIIAWLEKQKEYESTDFEYVWDRTDCGDLTSALDKYSEEAIINMCHAWYDKGIELERKSWLEKQGDHANFLNKIQIGDKVTRNEFGVLVNLSQLKRAAKTAEKQGEMSKMCPTSVQDEQQPIDKVEPKFKVGDWITNGDYTWKIVEVKPLDYILQSQDGNIVDDTISHVDEQFHSFTIKDAKDGDVLCTYECCEPKIVFILKGTPKKHYALSYHCYYNIMYPHFGTDSEKGCLAPKDEDVKPATKEQRDALFAKIKEEGYEWSEDTHELKKISQRMVSAEAKEALYDKPTDEEMKELLRTEYEKGRADTIAEMKSSWSEEDINKPNGGIVMEDFNDGNGFYKVNLAYLNEEQVKEIEELVKRWDCQPKENEDESIISDLLDYFEEDKCLKHEVNDVVKWLKTIKPQPNQKWSKDDERVIAIINNALTESNTPPDDYDKVYDWLESIKQRM